MLDFRLNTFLTLCEVGSYTKTAEVLHITQPAVTQHIKHIESYYGNKLFEYSAKSLNLTYHGRLLHEFATVMSADSKRIKTILRCKEPGTVSIHFGSTLTIGEYVMPKVMKKIFDSYPNTPISMEVDNTQLLLEKILHGAIDFALIEGNFDKTEYGYFNLSNEAFVGIAGSDFDSNGLDLLNLCSNHLIVREAGSGTRDILEKILFDNNLAIKSFKKVTEIGNMNAIKELVAENVGISFMYRAAALQELLIGRLVELDIPNFKVTREFNFVFLKDSIHYHEYRKWFDIIKARLS